MAGLSAEHLKKLREGRKTASDQYLVFDLDSKTRLTSSKHCWTMETRRTLESDWLGEHFYTTLCDAFVGYIKHRARRKLKSTASGDLDSLAKHLRELENLVKTTGEKIQALVDRMISSDPILASFEDGKE